MNFLKSLNWNRFIGDMALVFIMGCIIYLVGAGIFGRPFWQNSFDQMDYGFISGAAFVIMLRMKENVDELLETNEFIKQLDNDEASLKQLEDFAGKHPKFAASLFRVVNNDK